MPDSSTGQKATDQVAIAGGPIGVVGDHAHIEGGIHFYPPSTGKPLQRPPRAEHFTGRKDELAVLLAALQPGRVVTLCGPGGIGKTALAAEAVWTLAPGSEPPALFPDGVFFHTFYNQPQATLALEAIARAFGEEPKPAPRDAALRALAGKQALLLLDGAENADDLREVLDVRGGCGVLVTSRAHKDALDERQDVTPLGVDDAVTLLRAWGKEQAADDTAIHQICEFVGGLPLAVRLVGRYLAETSATAGEYLAWLRQTPLEALDQGQRREESVPVLLEKSLLQVSAAACQMLGVVGLLALAPFERAVLAAALDRSEDDLRKPLGELVNYGLLLRGQERYGVSHALIYTYAREKVKPEADVVRRLTEYYTVLAKAESAKGPEGYRRLDAEREHLMHMLAGCIERGEWKAVRSLVWAIDSYLDICGYWTERVIVLEAGVRATQALGCRHDEEVFMGSLGLAYRSLGRAEWAIEYCEHALTIAREIGDRRSEGAHLGNLGSVYRALGQVDRAIECHEQALIISREIGDRRGEGADLGNLGNIYSVLGQAERAIEYYKQALAIACEIGDPRGGGTRLSNLGSVYHALGQMEQAIEYYEQALTIAREIGDRRMEGQTLGNLGLTYRDVGHVEQAIVYYKQALAIAREIGDWDSEGNWLGSLGLIYSDLGRVEQAIEHYEQALVIAREVNDRGSEGIWLGNLGNAYGTLEQVERAIKYHQQALAIFCEIGDRRKEGVWLGNLGLTYMSIGDKEKSREYLLNARSIFTDLHLPIPPGIVVGLNRLAMPGCLFFVLSAVDRLLYPWNKWCNNLHRWKLQETPHDSHRPPL